MIEIVSLSAVADGETTGTAETVGVGVGVDEGRGVEVGNGVELGAVDTAGLALVVCDGNTVTLGVGAFDALDVAEGFATADGAGAVVGNTGATA